MICLRNLNLDVLPVHTSECNLSLAVLEFDDSFQVIDTIQTRKVLSRCIDHAKTDVRWCDGIIIDIVISGFECGEQCPWDMMSLNLNLQLFVLELQISLMILSMTSPFLGESMTVPYLRECDWDLTKMDFARRSGAEEFVRTVDFCEVSRVGF
jgi:hypothetical protein